MTERKKKKFIQIPEYPGGKEAFLKFIKENLIYPEEAIQNKVQGVVYLDIVVNDRGKVVEAKVTKGLGYGCNEEALRLVRMMKYGGASNPGHRVRSSKKVRIEFRLNESTTVKYTVLKPPEDDNDSDSDTYNYTINL